MSSNLLPNLADSGHEPTVDSPNTAAIKVQGLGKCYQIYPNPRDRLKQFFAPRVQSIFGLNPKQYFREFWALKDVSFEIKKGATLGVIGRNGSGKSTLLQILCGTLHPTSGQVEVNGRVAALLELGAGFNPEFTGRENVYMNAAVLGLTPEEVDTRFDSIAEFADIGDFIDQPVKVYSSGMYVRLAFAVIVHVDADILVIDEALAVGDAFFTQKCMRFLRNFKENGTLVFVSHDAGAVTGLCDSVLWLDKGILKAHDGAKRITEQYLASFYASESATAKATNFSVRKERSDNVQPLLVQKDIRSDLINTSTLRNDLQVFAFQPAVSADFGIRGAEIRHVALHDAHGEVMYHILGGEQVTLHIQVAAIQDLYSPIIGFSLKDKLGQVLFGDNTYLSYLDSPLSVQAGTIFEAQFSFQIPILPTGDYSIAAAIATGTQNDHIQHHWIHDALIIKSITSSVSTGLVGVPMSNIQLVTHDLDAKI